MKSQPTLPSAPRPIPPPACLLLSLLNESSLRTIREASLRASR
jgi:hypothetical protein